jgi:hypothetical protein
MDVIEGSGNKGNWGSFELVLGDEAAGGATWGGEFDGIRSDVDFRRALAIEGLTTTSSKANTGEKVLPIAAGLSRAAKAVRALGETLLAWRALLMPLR